VRVVDPDTEQPVRPASRPAARAGSRT
jgi:hypothetical protein